MKIKTPTEFFTFNGGICDIYDVKNNQRNKKIVSLYFSDRVIGMKRYYAARAATTEINRLIQIPKQDNITAMNRVVIDNTEYKIEQAQQIPDSNPPITILTLRKIGVIA